MLQTASLDGSWELRWLDAQRGCRPEFSPREDVDGAYAIPALVPGDVHLDLERAGILPDRNRNLGHLAGRWLETTRWTYRKVFASAATGRTWLCFAGIDLDAVIILNGIEIGRHANSFRPCRIEVTGKLKATDNILVVHVESGLFAAADKPSAGYLKPNEVTGKRHWLRKPQNQVGWDWSPRLMNVGLHGSVSLEWSGDAIRTDQIALLATVDDDLATGHLLTRVFVEGLGDGPVRTRIAVNCAGVTALADVEVAPGLHPYEVRLSVPGPRLWWPIGQGPQDRYEVTVDLQVAGTTVHHEARKIGFRHIRVDQSPCPAGGRWFYLEINHRRIFCKGGNYVPADTVIAAIDPARTKRLVELAVEQHFNLLRVWGGGRYEDATFYEACDAAGILVWQEFVFACCRYPGHDAGFYAEIAAEATHQLRRLSAHPSLVIWCGNNEIEWAYWDWGFTKDIAVPDYQLYHFLLPQLVAKEDGTRYWQPSSPFSPDGLNPNRDDVGDQHPWSLGFQDTDFRKYRAMECRFPNEGGFLGPNSLPTVRACLPQGDDSTWSFAWQQHDNAVAQWWDPCPPDQMLRQFVGKDIRALSIADYVYWGGLVHGEALSEYIVNFRRRRSTTTGAAVFWMYNGNWPAVRCWTTVDYYLRRTPAFHPVRRAFAPVAVVVYESGDRIVVSGVNDTPDVVVGELRHGLFDLGGRYLIDQAQPVQLAAFPKAAWTDPYVQAAFAVLAVNGAVISRHRLVLPLFNDLRWSAAVPEVRVANGQAIFTSSTFCWGICLDLDGERSLGDNFFDLYPGQPYAIPWTEAAPPRILQIGNLSAHAAITAVG